MNFAAVRGSGDPNEADGEYKAAIGLLYAVAFTIKMSKKETTGLTDILIMSCLRWRVSGGRKAFAV